MSTYVSTSSTSAVPQMASSPNTIEGFHQVVDYRLVGAVGRCGVRYLPQALAEHVGIVERHRFVLIGLVCVEILSVKHSAQGLRRKAFGARPSAQGLRRKAFGAKPLAQCLRRKAFGASRLRASAEVVLLLAPQTANPPDHHWSGAVLISNDLFFV